MASPIPLEYAGTVRAWMCGVCGHVHAHDDRRAWLANSRWESALSYRDRIATQIAALGGAP